MSRIVILVAMVLAIGSFTPARAPAQDQPHVKWCYKLVKIDTPGSHTDTTDQKSYAGTHQETLGADGMITTTIKMGNGSRYEGSVWTINARAGTASYTQKGPAGTAQVQFTPLPEKICRDDMFTFRTTVTAAAPVEAGVFFVPEAETWKDVKTEGTDPFSDHPGSGSFTGRFNPNNEHGFVIQVRMYDGGYGSTIEYHYAPANSSEPPLPPQPPQPPPQKCPDTFERDWANTSWGRFVMKVSGTTMTGEYTNRDGKFGPGTTTGTVTGHKYEGKWKDANGEGTISLTLSDDGCSCSGWHTVSPSTDHREGPRIDPITPRIPPKNGDPPSNFPSDPCMDAQVQQCIDKWIQLATVLRNKYDKTKAEPNGPWRNDQYGIWVGHMVSQGGKHDNWESVYHSSKYCYIWMEYQSEHTFAQYYGSELPPLASFVYDCYAKAMPPKEGPQQPEGPQPPASGKMTLEAMKRKVAPGETVLVPVYLWNGADVANMNYTLSYNAGIATVDGEPTAGYLLDDAMFTSNAKDTGVAKLAFSRSNGISGNGPVANVTFRAVGKAGDKTPLTLAVTIINNTTGAVPAIEFIHGEIEITGPGGALPGDCDGDGVITTADAWCALQMSVGNIPEKVSLDMDKDAKVTSRDATLILQQRVNR